MAKFVKLSKKQITSILSERLKWDKKYCIFDESGNLQQGFSSLLNLNSLEKIVKNFSELNPALFSTFNIRKLVEKAIVTILKELVVEDQAELEAEKKFEAFEYDEDRRIQSWIECKEYDAKISEEIDELVDKNSINLSEESESNFYDED